MRSGETSAPDATLLSSLTSCSSFFVGRRRSFEECEKGESKWTERGASSPSASSMTTTARRPDAAIAACTSVSKSFFHTAALCVMMRQRGSSERAAVSLLHSSLSSSSSLPSSKSRVALRRHRPRQMHPHPSACRSPSVAKWNLCVTAARSQSQAAADKTSK